MGFLLLNFIRFGLEKLFSNLEVEQYEMQNLLETQSQLISMHV